ncbi:KIN11 [Symbiodinium natans]|uniref:KIN11 protein n=1 Tax=Symbiodinium natans TaxID=878477 RepID=A0A812IFP9_9DINO|nr:KIN11 [Symbiodinium natans]
MEVTECDGTVFVFMERATGGDLFELIVARNRLQDKEARKYFRQIIDAVGFCHRNRVAHRDLKPENIFMDSNMNVKLGDFGLSAKFEWGTPLTESVGSPNYAAPELLQRACSYQGPEVDVWAAGCVLYAMITGTLPFDADRTDALFKLIKSGTYRMPGYVSEQAKDAYDLISKMLTIDREARASVATCHGRKMILSRYGHTFRWLSGNRAQLILTSAVEHADIRRHCWLEEEVRTKEVKARQPGF